MYPDALLRKVNHSRGLLRRLVALACLSVVVAFPAVPAPPGKPAPKDLAQEIARQIAIEFGIQLESGNRAFSADEAKIIYSVLSSLPPTLLRTPAGEPVVERIAAYDRDPSGRGASAGYTKGSGKISLYFTERQYRTDRRFRDLRFTREFLARTLFHEFAHAWWDRLGVGADFSDFKRAVASSAATSPADFAVIVLPEFYDLPPDKRSAALQALKGLPEEDFAKTVEAYALNTLNLVATAQGRSGVGEGGLGPLARKVRSVAALFGRGLEHERRTYIYALAASADPQAPQPVVVFRAEDELTDSGLPRLLPFSELETRWEAFAWELQEGS